MQTNLTLTDIKKKLHEQAHITSHNPARFFKTVPGGYSEHDRFLGIPTPQLRTLAKTCMHLSHEDIKLLLQSDFNEERLLALIILTEQYKKGSKLQKTKIYNFYLYNLAHVNNWNLVDSSAHLIIGAHLFEQDKTFLYQLAHSNNLWEKRIAIVATWYFIRKNQFEPTMHIAQILLHDTHDLIHKAVGWMLREMGKRDETVLKNFLDIHTTYMPRVMLSYSLEKFEKTVRTHYLNLKNKKT